MKRTGMSGWFIDKIPIDKRIAFFSRYGEWLDFLCEFSVFFVIIILLTGKYIRFKKDKELIGATKNDKKTR